MFDLFKRILAKKLRPILWLIQYRCNLCEKVWYCKGKEGVIPLSCPYCDCSQYEEKLNMYVEVKQVWENWVTH